MKYMGLLDRFRRGRTQQNQAKPVDQNKPLNGVMLDSKAYATTASSVMPSQDVLTDEGTIHYGAIGRGIAATGINPKTQAIDPEQKVRQSTSGGIYSYQIPTDNNGATSPLSNLLKDAGACTALLKDVTEKSANLNEGTECITALVMPNRVQYRISDSSKDSLVLGVYKDGTVKINPEQSGTFRGEALKYVVGLTGDFLRKQGTLIHSAEGTLWKDWNTRTERPQSDYITQAQEGNGSLRDFDTAESFILPDRAKGEERDEMWSSVSEVQARVKEYFESIIKQADRDTGLSLKDTTSPEEFAKGLLQKLTGSHSPVKTAELSIAVTELPPQGHIATMHLASSDHQYGASKSAASVQSASREIANHLKQIDPQIEVYTDQSKDSSRVRTLAAAVAPPPSVSENPGISEFSAAPLHIVGPTRYVERIKTYLNTVFQEVRGEEVHNFDEQICDAISRCRSYDFNTTPPYGEQALTLAFRDQEHRNTVRDLINNHITVESSALMDALRHARAQEISLGFGALREAGADQTQAPATTEQGALLNTAADPATDPGITGGDNAAIAYINPNTSPEDVTESDLAPIPQYSTRIKREALTLCGDPEDIDTLRSYLEGGSITSAIADVFSAVCGLKTDSTPEPGEASITLSIPDGGISAIQHIHSRGLIGTDALGAYERMLERALEYATVAASHTVNKPAEDVTGPLPADEEGGIPYYQPTTDFVQTISEQPTATQDSTSSEMPGASDLPKTAPDGELTGSVADHKPSQINSNAEEAATSDIADTQPDLPPPAQVNNAEQAATTQALNPLDKAELTTNNDGSVTLKLFVSEAASIALTKFQQTRDQGRTSATNLFDDLAHSWSLTPKEKLYPVNVTGAQTTVNTIAHYASLDPETVSSEMIRRLFQRNVNIETLHAYAAPRKQKINTQTLSPNEGAKSVPIPATQATNDTPSTDVSGSILETAPAVTTVVKEPVPAL